MNLRPYQVKLVADARASIVSGYRYIMICSPTGSGKTVVFSHIAIAALAKGYKIGIAVHRSELIEQAKDKLVKSGVKPQQISIIKGGRAHYRDAPVIIASVQTLIKRDAYYDSAKVPALWIIDEAHRQEFDKLFSRPELSHSLVIGFTATPVRSGKMNQLGTLYETLIEAVTIRELVQDGYLARPTYILPAQQVETSGFTMDAKSGDYKTGESFNAFNKPEVYAGIIEGYREAGEGKALVFCASIEHCKLTTEEFRRSGYNATWIDGTMSEKVRADIVAKYLSGFFQVLVNCDILTVGFDCPDIEVIILNRATASLSLYLQMCGRGSRVTDRKREFTIVDAGTNQKRLGPWEAERPYSLWHKAPLKKGVSPVKDCPQCNRILHASVMKCGYCGFEFERKEDSVKVAEGWERFTFEQQIELSAVSHRSKAGKATIYDLIKLKENKVLTKPYALFNRAIACGIDPYELAPLLGYDAALVDKFIDWAQSKGIPTSRGLPELPPSPPSFA